MHFENENPRRNIYRQFSLSMLLLLVTGIACYLGGRMHGYRQGVAIWDAAPKIAMSYGVADLITIPKFGSKAFSPVDLLVQQIKNEVMPGVWHTCWIGRVATSFLPIAASFPSTCGNNQVSVNSLPQAGPSPM